MNVGGCTKYLQPADVCWNRPFTLKLSELHDTWVAGGGIQLTANGRPRAPFENVCQWICDAWGSI